MPLIGNTVKLKADFKGYEPTSVSVTIYRNDKIIEGPVSLEEDNKEGIGMYFYEMIVPDVSGKIYYQFSGIVEGRVLTNRRFLPRRWYSR